MTFFVMPLGSLCVYLQNSLFALLCSSLGSTAAVVEYSYPMWERLNVSTSKVIDTKNG